MNLNDIFWLKEGSVDLLVETYSNIATIVQIRGLTDNEMVIHDHTTTSDRALASSVVGITAAPRFLTARCATTGIKRGQVYTRVSLRVEGVVVATLYAGYVDETPATAYPNGVIEDAKSGIGHLRSITGTNPAAGAEFSETVPTGALWRLRSGSVVLTCDATVANRQSKLRIDDGTDFVFYGGFGANSVAGEVSQVCWAAVGASAPSSNSGRLYQIPIDFKIPGGYRIRSATSSIQAGDNYDAPQLYVEEFMNP